MKRRLALLMVLMLLIPIVLSPSLAHADIDGDNAAVCALDQPDQQSMDGWFDDLIDAVVDFVVAVIKELI